MTGEQTQILTGTLNRVETRLRLEMQAQRCTPQLYSQIVAEMVHLTRALTGRLRQPPVCQTCNDMGELGNPINNRPCPECQSEDAPMEEIPY